MIAAISLKQLLFCKKNFFRSPSCVEQLLLSSSFLQQNSSNGCFKKTPLQTFSCEFCIPSSSWKTYFRTRSCLFIYLDMSQGRKLSFADAMFSFWSTPFGQTSQWQRSVWTNLKNLLIFRSSALWCIISDDCCTMLYYFWRLERQKILLLWGAWFLKGSIIRGSGRGSNIHEDDRTFYPEQNNVNDKKSFSENVSIFSETMSGY